VIPAGSQIVAIIIWTTAVWATTTTLGVGTTASATAFTTAGAVTGLGTLGQFNVTPGTALTQISNWVDVGTTDVQLAISTSTGTGTGWITVKYAQALNLTP
jgi:hypothetical protein